MDKLNILPVDTRPRESMGRNSLLGLLSAVAYFFWMLRFFPYWDMFWISSDEGFELMKAFLASKGYSLYGQIWSDQPPLFTHMLVAQFRFINMEVHTSRLLVLALSSLMIATVFILLSSLANRRVAFLGVLFLVLLPSFQVLSAAALAGQPALLFGCISLLGVVLWHTDHKAVWLVSSAVFLAISVMIKLFTGLLLPVLLSGLLLDAVIRSGKQPVRKNDVRPVLTWLSVFLVMTAVILLLTVPINNFYQLFQPHLAAATMDATTEEENAFYIIYHLQFSWMYLPAIVAGIYYNVQKKRWLTLYLVGWIGVSFLFLSIISPVWWHHQLLVTIPASMLAALGAGDALREVTAWIQEKNFRRRNWVPAALGLLGACLIIVFRTPELAANASQSILQANAAPRASSEDRIMKKIEQFAPQTNWMVTDLPMYAFRSRIPVPPELAVMSWKRFTSSNLNDAEVLRIIQLYRPEQIIFGRFDFPLLKEYLRENYHIIYERDKLKLYLLKTIQ
jgi:4-amino-4-deoxy-L-arabinose transferase-like glycosyltransferase